MFFQKMPICASPASLIPCCRHAFWQASFRTIRNVRRRWLRCVGCAKHGTLWHRRAALPPSLRKTYYFLQTVFKQKHAKIQNREIACGPRKRHDFYDSCPIGLISIFMNLEEHSTAFLCSVFIKRSSFLFFMTPKEILATLIFLPSTGSGIS